MDNLAAFEKSLALERAGREAHRPQQKERRKRHRHRNELRHREKDGQTGTSRYRSGDEAHGQDDEREPNRRPNEEQPRHRYRTVSERDVDNEGHRHKRLPTDLEPKSSVSRKRIREATDSGEVGDIGSAEPRDETELLTRQGGKALGEPGLVRDSWMRAPSDLDIDYIHRNSMLQITPPPKDTTSYNISERELNHDALQHLNRGKTLDDFDLPTNTATEYSFGDDGSQWRMTKLNGVYTVAQQTNRAVEEVAVERFGSLQKFDEAREEKVELERRRLYGKDYVAQKQPGGDLSRERERLRQLKEEKATASKGVHDFVDKTALASTPIDQTTLNRLRAQLMKAKLRKLPDTKKLEDEYNEAMRAFSMGVTKQNPTERAIVLDAAHSRMLTGTRSEVRDVETRRGRERGLVEANEDMSVEDMVREERRTRGTAGGESMRFAERIATDSKFDDDLEYLDENAERLAKRLHRSKASLKTAAVHDFTKMNKILESCPLCHHEDRPPPQNVPLAPMISLATRVFLTLATEPELTGAEGGAVIVPIDHHTNLLECDDDEWEEIRNFMKSLTRLYHDQGRNVLFYENAAIPHRRMHAVLVAVPIPYELGDTAPAFFREAMLEADEEWSQHKKIVDTAKRARDGLGKQAFRKSIAKEMPYFHVWFTLDGGLGHIVEDTERWPRGDLFAREVIGGMLDVDASIIKRHGSWVRTGQSVEDFKRRWKRFDWTRVLTN